MGNRCRIPSRNFGAALAPLPATRHAESFQHRPDAVSRKGFDPTGKIPPRFAGQVGDVFRVETATHQIDDLRAYRPKEGGPADDLKWRPLRYGVADLHRRTKISQRFNERYLNALSVIDDSTQMSELIRILEKPRGAGKQRVRALHPFSADDHALLKAVNRGEFAINGLRNRDLQILLYNPGPLSRVEKRRRSAAIGHKLRLLRMHGIIQKVAYTHRYQVTAAGRL